MQQPFASYHEGQTVFLFEPSTYRTGEIQTSLCVIDTVTLLDDGFDFIKLTCVNQGSYYGAPECKERTVAENAKNIKLSIAGPLAAQAFLKKESFRHKFELDVATKSEALRKAQDALMMFTQHFDSVKHLGIEVSSETVEGELRDIPGNEDKDNEPLSFEQVLTADDPEDNYVVAPTEDDPEF